MTRSRKRLFVSGISVCALIILLTALKAILPDLYKPVAEERLSVALGKDVTINGPVSVTLFPPLGIEAGDIRVIDDGERVISIEEVSIVVEPLSLISSAPRLSRVAVRGAKIDLVRHEDGSLNLGFVAPATVSDRKQGVSDTARTKDHRIYIGIDRIVIESSSLSYTDMKTGMSVSFTGLDLTASGQDSRNLAERGILTLDPVKLEAFGGKGLGKVTMDLAGSPRRFAFSVVLDDLKSQRVLATFGRDRFLQGDLDLRARISTQGDDYSDMISNLSGVLVMDGRGLEVPNMDLDDIVAKLETSQNFNLLDLGAYFFAGPLGAVATHSYKFANLTNSAFQGNSRIERLHSEWKIENGIMSAEDVAFTTKLNRIALDGGIDLPDQRFARLTIAVVDDRGYAKARQIMNGPFSSPLKSRTTFQEAVWAPIENLIKAAGSTAGKLISGDKDREIKVFYRGSVPHPSSPVTLSGRPDPSSPEKTVPNGIPGPPQEQARNSSSDPTKHHF